MPHSHTAFRTRRQFLGTQAGLLAGSTAALARPFHGAFAGGSGLIRLGMIGCGNRGNGAVANALNTSNQGPIELHVLADLQQSQIDRTIDTLSKQFADKINVPADRQFPGFDAYRQAVDALQPGDIAMCTTRAYIRPLHVEYAVSKGIHVFMEKPFACDPAGLRRMRRAGQLAEQTGAKIAAGLQCRHSPARAALIDRIRNGDLGELLYVRANRLTGRRWMGDMGSRSNDLIEQLRFGKINLMWVGSGHMVDNLIHQIDECCWLMDDWPVSCHGMGGREVGSTDHGQNLDAYSMEFTFPDGRKAMCGFRRALKGHTEFATFVHGSKKAGQFSGNVHAATVHMFRDHHIADSNIEWSPEPDAKSPWDYEWVSFIDSIRNGKPHNEAERAVKSDYASLMGRAAAHMNQIVTWDDVTNSDFSFCPDTESLTFDSPPPVLADTEGFFPAPHAGVWKEL